MTYAELVVQAGGQADLTLAVLGILFFVGGFVWLMKSLNIE